MAAFKVLERELKWSFISLIFSLFHILSLSFSLSLCRSPTPHDCRLCFFWTSGLSVLIRNGFLHSEQGNSHEMFRLDAFELWTLKEEKIFPKALSEQSWRGFWLTWSALMPITRLKDPGSDTPESQKDTYMIPKRKHSRQHTAKGSVIILDPGHAEVKSMPTRNL